MKIGQPTDIPIPATASASPAAAKTGAAALATQNAQSAGVAVTVSTTARNLEQVAKSDGAEVDVDKVNSVRSAIEQGTYVVNAEAIADKLLANAQEMLDRTRR
jgi:negative regulator of flagellin synthesis FlgM